MINIVEDVTEDIPTISYSTKNPLTKEIMQTESELQIQVLIKTLQNRSSISSQQLLNALLKIQQKAQLQNKSQIIQYLVSLTKISQYNDQKQLIQTLKKNSSLDCILFLLLCWPSRQSVTILKFVNVLLSAYSAYLMINGSQVLKKWRKYMQTLIEIEQTKKEIIIALNEQDLNKSSNYVDYFIPL